MIAFEKLLSWLLKGR